MITHEYLKKTRIFVFGSPSGLFGMRALLLPRFSEVNKDDDPAGMTV